MTAVTESPPPIAEQKKTPKAQRPTPNVEVGEAKNGANGGVPVLVQEVPLSEIVRSPFNREVDTKTPEFAELVDSIRIHGVIQPGVARPLTMDPPSHKATADRAARLELVIGEHRWLASLTAKRVTMPLIVRQLSDVEVVELQTVENDKRKDLSPIEEAEKYQQLITQYEKAGLKKEAAIAKLCEKLSKGKSTVYEALRLLELPAETKAAVKSGKLPPSHAGLIAKLPTAAQSLFAKIIAPGKRVTSLDDAKFEKDFGVYIDGERDEQTGLISFRDAKEMVDGELRNIELATKYESKAGEFRKKGGVALTWAEARKERNDLLSANDYLPTFSSYVNQVTKGVKDLPKQIMRPSQHDPSRPELVYRRAELVAALKKSGVKARASSDGRSTTDYARLERARQARQRVAKAVLKAAIDPIRAAAGKRNAKIPWPLFIVTMAGWTASQICQRRGWKASYSNAGKVLAEHLAKIPENQMPGLVADILIEKTTTTHTGGHQPEFVQLGNFYGVDVKAIAKETQQKLAPPEKKQKVAKPPSRKATAGQGKAKVQTPGTASAKAMAVKTKKAKKTGLTAAARKKLAEAMKAAGVKS